MRLMKFTDAHNGKPVLISPLAFNAATPTKVYSNADNKDYEDEREMIDVSSVSTMQGHVYEVTETLGEIEHQFTMRSS